MKPGEHIKVHADWSEADAAYVAWTNIYPMVRTKDATPFGAAHLAMRILAALDKDPAFEAIRCPGVE